MVTIKVRITSYKHIIIQEHYNFCEEYFFREWHISNIPGGATALDGSACTITKAYGLLKNLQFDDDPCAIKDYIKNDYPTLIKKQIINCTNLTIDPTSYALLQKAQPTSAAVDGLFSILSKLLRKDRNFDVKNVKKI